MLVSKLVNKAWYRSKIYSSQFQPSGVGENRMTQGIEELNELLGEFSISGGLIPYFTLYESTIGSGTESILIPNCIFVETITTNDGTLRIPTIDRGVKNFFGSARVDDVQSLVNSTYAEKVHNGVRINFYPLPDSSYTIKVYGKFRIPEVFAETELDDLIEIGYQKFLIYALANSLCEASGYETPASIKRGMLRMKDDIENISSIDLDIQKQGLFDGSSNNGPSTWMEVFTRTEGLP